MLFLLILCGDLSIVIYEVFPLQTILVSILCKIQNLEPKIFIEAVIHEPNSIYMQQARPFLEGVRLVNGADIVLGDPACFSSVRLEQRLYNYTQMQDFLSEDCRQDKVYEAYISPK